MNAQTDPVFFARRDDSRSASLVDAQYIREPLVVQMIPYINYIGDNFTKAVDNYIEEVIFLVHSVAGAQTRLRSVLIYMTGPKTTNLGQELSLQISSCY